MTHEYFQSEPVVCNDRLKHFHSPQDQRESFHLTWAELGLKLQENIFTGNHWAALESQNLYLSGGITKKILWVFSLIDLILPVEAVGRTSARTVRQTLQMSSEEKTTAWNLPSRKKNPGSHEPLVSAMWHRQVSQPGGGGPTCDSLRLWRMSFCFSAFS